MKYIIRTCMAALLLTIGSPAHATDQQTPKVMPSPDGGAAPKVLPDPGSIQAEQKDTSFVYSPEGCDFEITFPETPFNTRRCPDGGRDCYNITSYTMVYDLRTTVDISVTCNPSTPDNYARYSEGVMRTALEGMIARKQIDEYNIGFQQYETVRQATLTGTGSTGRQGKIYTAQIWAGQNSIFTLQAELVGGAHPEADAMFRNVLKSLQMKSEKKEAAPATEKSDDADENKESDDE